MYDIIDNSYKTNIYFLRQRNNSCFDGQVIYKRKHIHHVHVSRIFFFTFIFLLEKNGKKNNNTTKKLN